MDLAEEPGHSDADQENPNQRPICDGQPFQLQESYKATARLTSRVIEQVEDLSGAMDLMEEMQVSMEGVETLDDALERLELHRKKMETGGRPNEGSQVFTHIKDIDDEGRSNLQAIFSDVIDHMAFLDHEGVIVERLRAEALLKGQSASEDLMMRRAALNSGECPILVAGETSSGKSSLLNVLLQDKVLPEDHLPCTATITRIKYAPPNEKRIVIRQVNDCAHTDDEMETVIPLKDAGVSIHDALKPYLFPEDRSKQLAYTVDIFLPLDVLKSGVYIVDTPGIGESEIMDRILTYFIDQNSVFAFIYVILSDNAGGVQEDRLQKLLKMLVEHQDADSANSFDPRSAIFVCNRWDLVPKEDRKMVKEKIIKDLDKCWPGISPEKQVFTMSAKKARVSMGLGYVSDDYDTLLNGIKELVPISLQRQILLSYNWLRRFVTRTMTTAEVYVSNASLSKEDLLKVHRQVEQKLQTFRDNADSKMEELTKDLEDNIEFTATCLKDHFYTTEVKQELTEWKLPDTQGGLLFEDFESIIEETINKKIMSIISSWEKKGNYMAAALESQFKKYATHFQLLESELKQIEDELIEKTNAYPMGNLQDITDEFHIDVEGLMDDDVARTPIVTLKEKVAIGLFAPVILPVGFVAGIFAAIPMALFGLSSIKKWIRRKRQDEVVHLYRANPTVFLTKQANKICEVFQDLGHCKECMEGRFEDASHQLEIMKTHIPKLVEGTQRLLTCIQDDQRSKDKIIDTYRPLVETLGIGQGSILYRLERFYLKFIDRKSYGVESFSTIQPTDSIVRSGIWSQVYPLHLKDSGEKVMIKAYLEVTEDDVLDDIAALRFLGKPGEIYVPALMGSFNDPSTSLPSLVFSGTIMSLRKRCVRKIGHVSSKEDCKWRLFVSLIPLLQQLIDALEWLHRKGFVHMELSMETVMVDQPPEKHGHIQLFNIGCPRPANIPSAGRLQPLGACRYLPLEVLQGGVYTHDGDIYGFGLIMWELWNGQQVYDDASDVTVEEFTNRLLTGEAVLSALSDVHGANAQGLETKWWAIIQKCTQRQPEERLNQNQIKRELEAYVGSILAKPTLKKGYEPVTPQLPQVNYKPGYRNPDISES